MDNISSPSQYAFSSMSHGASTSPAPGSSSSQTDAPDGFDVDEGELIQLYKRIPPPDLRAFALARAREKVVTEGVRKVKEDGIFDSFRKTWLKDLEAKVSVFFFA